MNGGGRTIFKVWYLGIAAVFMMIFFIFVFGGWALYHDMKANGEESPEIVFTVFVLGGIAFTGFWVFITKRLIEEVREDVRREAREGPVVFGERVLRRKEIDLGRLEDMKEIESIRKDLKDSDYIICPNCNMVLDESAIVENQIRCPCCDGTIAFNR